MTDLLTIRDKLLRYPGIMPMIESDVPDKSVLVIEPTNWHGEVIPPVVNYFLKMGFHVDVVVSDGFSGNVCLKTIEGTAEILFGEIKEITKSSFKAKLGALMLKKNLYGLKRKYDHKKVGGAPLLGVSKIVLKCHGNSKAESVAATIEQAYTLGKNKLIEKVIKAVGNEE